VKHRFRCLLPELLIDRTKISVSNVQRHVVNEINECQSGSGASRFSESWNIKLNPATELGVSVSGAKHWWNRTKMSNWSGWNTQIHKFKGTTNCWFVVQCSIFSIYCSMFRTEDDAVHFARTLVHITLKEFIIHNAAFEHPYAAMVMSTDLLQAACNFSLHWTAFGRIHLFLEILHFMINSFGEATSNSSILW